MALDNSVESIIQRSEEAAVGFEAQDYTTSVGGTSILSWMVRAGELLPRWWSRARDKTLSAFWKDANHMAIAVYNSQSKLVGIPFRIVARNPNISEHVDRAENLTYLYHIGSEFGKSWDVAYSKFIEDLLTQDNGAFMEIIGDGPAGGGIVGTPFGVRHLDSWFCERTGDPEFPVKYIGEDGKRYKIHYSRVIMTSQMPSSRRDMYGVGMCAVSRSFDIAQNLLDITRYKQERLGSRPANQIIVGKGITGEQIMQAFAAGEEESSNRNHSRYSRTVAIGSENPDIDLTKLELNHMEPFDEETSMTLGMFAVAAAFGMDATELWPTGSGSTNRADSSLRRMRSRGKLPAQTTSELKKQLDFKLVPPYLEVVFDFRDDEEDQQRALIKDIRARNRERDLGAGAVDIRTARQMMLNDGDLGRGSFDEMEMFDGRLPDGTSIATLFYSEDPLFTRHLSFGDADPLVILDNNKVDMVTEIQRKNQGVMQEWAKTTSASKGEKLAMAHAALTWLQEIYLRFTLNPQPEVPISERRMTADTVDLTRTEYDLDTLIDQGLSADNLRDLGITLDQDSIQRDFRQAESLPE
jgi:hypothetical protein